MHAFEKQVCGDKNVCVMIAQHGTVVSHPSDGRRIYRIKTRSQTVYQTKLAKF